MKRFVLAILAIGTLSVQGEEPARADARPVEFYVGVSVGHDRMTAKRTEDIKARTDTQLFFSNDKTQKTNGISGKIIAGFLWRVPNTAFVLSPEVYIGLGGAQINLNKSEVDSVNDTTRSYQGSFKQNLTMGVVLRAGFYLTGDNNFLYVLIGKDRSKFQNKFMLSSSDIAGTIIPTLFEKRSQFLRSSIFGVGFERKFNSFKVGIDCRYMPYSSWENYSRKVEISRDILSIRFKPKVVSTSLTFSYLF